MSEKTRDRIIDLVRRMREQTTSKGATPGEAAKFAAKVARMIEEYQITEAELHGGQAEIEVCQNKIHTGKKVFNPGYTQIVAALSRAMCCEPILLREQGMAVYGVVGDFVDADYVCQIAPSIVSSLTVMARLEAVEYGEEGAGIIRWTNQYLMGAATEIQHRIEQDRKQRADAKELEYTLSNSSDIIDAVVSQATQPQTALVLVTGETVAAQKREAVGKAFKEMYPKTTNSARSKSEFDWSARSRGREAGKTVSLKREIESR